MAQSVLEPLPGEQPSPHAAHDDAHADPFLAHHFDTPKHQFESGKLGIWLFLITEILFFGGLFCAYAIYRSLHPEIFVYAHYYLDTFWGAVNTCVLIVSSLTAAWAVRNAQLGEQKKLVFNIIATVLLACCFLCVKYVEYAHKFHEHTLPGKYFNPEHEVWELESYKKAHHGHAEEGAAAHGAAAALGEGATPATGAAASALPAASAVPAGAAVAVGAAASSAGTPSAGTPSAAAPGGAVPAAVAPGSPTTAAPGGSEALPEAKTPPPGAIPRPRHVAVFFAIYFCMTGLHGIHVVAGIITWLWILRRTLRGEFGPTHFGAVDYAALYWHLVDLIWIYLFPLLYLIH
jgi:cytochrome c oxidase subunit 3